MNTEGRTHVKITQGDGSLCCTYGVYGGYDGLGFSIDLRLDKFIEELELIYE